jgi:riboflavin kinase/FMN adenylyltransferase
MEVVGELAQVVAARDSVVTIGTFDGVHLGHQQLIRELVTRAHATDRAAALITFFPHPKTVLTPQHAPRCLTTPAEKMALLEELGVDLVVQMHFDEHLVATPAAEFIEAVWRSLRMTELWVGSDFALGRDRGGDESSLQELGLELGFRVQAIQPVVGTSDVGLAVSSSRIRMLLADGQVEKASILLGRHPSVSGGAVLVPQQGLGTGFLAMHLTVGPRRAVPGTGIYSAEAFFGGVSHPSVASITCPAGSEEGGQPVTVYVPETDIDPGDCCLAVAFVSRLRDQHHRVSARALGTQIQLDLESTQRILRSRRDGSALRRSSLAAQRAHKTHRLPFRHEEVQHTADRAIQVWGEGLPELFEGAAHGMYQLMADTEGLVVTHRREVQLEAYDLESLLVEWLNELLYLTEAEGMMWLEFDIAFPSQTQLFARVGGMRAEATRGTIKAATFHNLKVCRDGAGWSTLLTFDV